jgi:hypothetical protein
MRFILGLCMLTTFALAGCGGSTVGTSQREKSEGLPITALSHDQLLAVYRECTQYGQIDDPKVRYTARYCTSVQSAHLSEGFAVTSKAKVDPTLNKMH